MAHTQRIRLVRQVAFLLPLIFGLASRCYGQFETAAVLGTVLDPNSAVVALAHVSLHNLDTGVSQSTVTDANGTYQFLQARVGRYKVTAESPGFKRAETPEFRVEVGARQRVDLTLEIGEVSQTVEVNETTSMLQPESSDRGQVVSHEEVANLPLNGRSSAALALLAPGIRLAYGLGKREASFNVSGLRSQFNNFILDGVDNNAYGTSNQGLSNQVVQVSPDAVQEFKVITNSYSAEYGRVGGAVVNASVRSGTNQLHGAVWEYLRNTDLNAVGFFKPVGGQKPVYIQNQFGGAAGGPIKRNKVFIFADYEGLRRFQRSLSFASVPTMAQRAGSFGIAVKDPYSKAVYSNGIIPAAALTQFGTKVFGYLPAPNLTGNSKNYSALLPATDDDKKGDIRYDHYLTSKITVFSRYSHRLYYQLAAPNSGVPGPSGQGDGIVSRVMNWQTATGLTWTVSPTSIAEFRFGASQSEGKKTPATLDGGANMAELYGITGLPTSSALTGGLNTQNVTGYQSYGRDYTSPLETYFFPKVAPLVEKALKDGNKGNWPIITLYLDIKNDPKEHLEAISKVLDKYDAWLTKAVKTDDITKQSPLELKPMMIILEDKKEDIKQAFFYDSVPVGGKIRAFGSPTKFDDNPTHLPRTAKAERFANMLKFEPSQLVTKKADNYHRWFGTDWAFIELCGAEHANDWNAATEARVKKFVDYGHSLGYLVGFYSINGFTEQQNQGWTAEFNFGTEQAALLRWNAAIKAHADFIATDQYEELTKVIRVKH